MNERFELILGILLKEKKICDAAKSKEVLVALTVGSRKAVDELVDKALQAGAKEPRAPEDHGWMYGRSFQDLDNHIWEPFYMDMKALGKMNAAAKSKQKKK